MTRTVLAAMTGVTFGVVLAVSGFVFHAGMGTCRYQARRAAVQVQAPAPAQVIVVQRPAMRPCPAYFVEPETQAVDVNAQAEQYMANARALARKHPNQARAYCRKAMQLFHNNPRNAKVRSAYKLLNTIPHDDDDSDDE